MEWNKLLSNQRAQRTPSLDEHRSPFERDWDRVIFSASFRRLQDKTQVIPLPQQDFVHTRLTHSLETSTVGRSLGIQVSNRLARKDPGEKPLFGEIPLILACACLAHDIGNPPFGHSGEEAISAFFLTGLGKELIGEFSENQRLDFEKFEGNANGFHLLRASPQLTLTSAVLAAFTKYPVTSEGGFDKSDVRTKKYGLFSCDRENYSRVAQDLGIPLVGGAWLRHPLAFLTEAADDICYSLIDFEDGYKMKLISYEDFRDLLLKVIGSENEGPVITRLKGEGSSWTDDEKASYLRAKAIGTLVEAVAEAFVSREEEIRRGQVKNDLIHFLDGAKREALDLIKGATKSKVYRWEKVLQIESAGFEVLGGLLHKFTAALFSEGKGASVAEKEKLMVLLPLQFWPAALKVNENDLDSRIRLWKEDAWKKQWQQDKEVRYRSLLGICSFVAGMTDSYAVTMFRRLKGIELPT